MSGTASGLLLYNCPAFSAWLTVTACTALKRSVKVGPRERTWRPMPCYGCCGVVELHRQGETPAPRRVAT